MKIFIILQLPLFLRIISALVLFLREKLRSQVLIHIGRLLNLAVERTEQIEIKLIFGARYRYSRLFLLRLAPVWLFIFCAEDPVPFELFFALLHERLQRFQILMRPKEEGKAEQRVQLRVEDLLGLILVVGSVLFCDLVQVWWNCSLCVVGVKEDQMLVLHAHQVVRFSGTAAKDAHILFAFKKVLQRLQILLLNGLNTQADAAYNENVVDPHLTRGQCGLVILFCVLKRALSEFIVVNLFC